jgi:hypothetical protein
MRQHGLGLRGLMPAALPGQRVRRALGRRSNGFGRILLWMIEGGPERQARHR